LLLKVPFVGEAKAGEPEVLVMLFLEGHWIKQFQKALEVILDLIVKHYGVVVRCPFRGRIQVICITLRKSEHVLEGRRITMEEVFMDTIECGSNEENKVSIREIEAGMVNHGRCGGGQ